MYSNSKKSKKSSESRRSPKSTKKSGRKKVKGSKKVKAKGKGNKKAVKKKRVKSTSKKSASKIERKITKKGAKSKNIGKTRKKIPIRRAAGGIKGKKIHTTVEEKKKKSSESIKRLEEIKKLEEIRSLFSLKYARQLLVLVGGENAYAVVSGLTKNSTDEELAKRLKLKISDIRSALNRLHEKGIVGYIRTKDEETGWYTYTWYINIDRIKEWINEHIESIHKLGKEANTFYCRKCGIENPYSMEEAIEYNFTCPICERQMRAIEENIMNKEMNENPDKVIHMISKLKRI